MKRNIFGIIWAAFLVASIGSSGARAEEPKTAAEARLRLSGTLCYASAERTKFKAQIDEQKRGARIGGVVNKGKVYEAQQEIVAMDMLIDSVNRSLKSLHSKPMDCRKIDRVKLESFFSCIDGQRSDAEDDPAAESVSQIMSASVTCAAGEGL